MKKSMLPGGARGASAASVAGPNDEIFEDDEENE